MHFAGQTAERMARHYVETRRWHRPLSLKRAVRALRAVMSETPMTDRELADLIAKAAVEAKMVVDFDVAESSTEEKRGP